MTRPVPNLNAAIVDKLGKVIPPWNSWFQAFTQAAPAIVDIIKNPYQPNKIGIVVLIGATTITLTRGLVAISLTGQKIVPVSIGDIISWTGPATVQFLEQ